MFNYENFSLNRRYILLREKNIGNLIHLLKIEKLMMYDQVIVALALKG